MYYITIERNGRTYYLKDLVSLSHEPTEGSDYSDGMFYAEWTPTYEDRNVFQTKEDAADIVDNYIKKGEVVRVPMTGGVYTANVEWSVTST